MSKSDYLENKLNDHVLGGPAYIRPATVYVGLNSADPTDTGAGAELSGGNYSRVAIANNSANWPASVAGVKSNGTAITFATASANWTTATHFSVWDALGGGNLLRHGPLTTPRLVLNGDTPTFPIGTLICTET